MGLMKGTQQFIEGFTQNIAKGTDPHILGLFDSFIGLDLVIDSYVNGTDRDDANNSVVDDINGDEAPGASNVGKSKRTESKGVVNNQSKVLNKIKTLNQITYNTDVNNTVYENIDNMLMFQVLMLNTIVM